MRARSLHHQAFPTSFRCHMPGLHSQAALPRKVPALMPQGDAAAGRGCPGPGNTGDSLATASEPCLANQSSRLQRLRAETQGPRTWRTRPRPHHLIHSACDLRPHRMHHLPDSSRPKMSAKTCAGSSKCQYCGLGMKALTCPRSRNPPQRLWK